MLNFRPINYNSDIGEIVELLKTSLSSRHSKESFLWKHYENPFGRSFGLLACDGRKIVGVRMFMYWEFVNDDEIIKAIRPVDTITHKDYRGRGIFKKLTLDGLKNIDGLYEIIFNTPNENSLPGYLKMGWEEFEPSFNYYLSFLLPSAKFAKRIYFPKENLADATLVNFNYTNRFKTNTTLEFLKWRYSNKDYTFSIYKEDLSSLLIVFRIQKVKGLKTLILVDYVGSTELLKSALKGLAFKLKIITVYGLNLNYIFNLNKFSGLSKVVYKHDIKKIQNSIGFSLGDLEGRL